MLRKCLILTNEAKKYNYFWPDSLQHEVHEKLKVKKAEIF